MRKQETVKPPTITPGLLVNDNHSEEALALRAEWEAFRDRGALSLIIRCSDARIILPNPTETMSIRTIAAGGLKEPYQSAIDNSNVDKILILAHHDGETVLPGKMPEGCGGLKAKGEDSGEREYLTGIAAYVADEVEHPDVIMHAWRSAAETALFTSKPVMAATQNHLTGDVFPLAIYSDYGKRLVSAVNPLLLDEDRYDPAVLYKDGIPTLSEKDLPQSFRDYFRDYAAQLRRLRKTHPDLSRTQKVQSPSLLVITDRSQPLEDGYPTTMGEPNTTFKLSVARTTQAPDIIAASIERSLNQAEYPIVHFPITTIFIETFRMSSSEKIATELRKRDWMKNITAHIIVGQANRRVLEQARIF